MKPHKQVAVITGASSGIGHATALRLATLGYHLALAARSKKALREVTDACRALGVIVLPLAVDVSNETDVTILAKETIKQFGGFDIWINNAGVTSVGMFTETPPATFRQVIETNLFGVVYGTRAALSHFNHTGSGTIINMSSVFGAVPGPYESAYVASKFAVRGFSGSIRQELQLQGLHDVHVCTVLPAAIDTPIYRNAANYTGRQVQPIPPIYDADLVVDTITHLIAHPLAEASVGSASRMVAGARTLLPKGWFEKLFGHYIKAVHFTDDFVNRTDGSVQSSSHLTTISGNWPRNPVDWQPIVYIGGGLVAAALLAYLLLGNDDDEEAPA